MSFSLLLLPDDVLIYLLSELLELKDICSLDSAVTDKIHRETFLNFLRTIHFSGKKIVGSVNYFHWLLKRKIVVTSINLSSLSFNFPLITLMTIAGKYSENFGQQIQSLTCFVDSTNIHIQSLISIAFPMINLSYLRIRGIITSNCLTDILKNKQQILQLQGKVIRYQSLIDYSVFSENPIILANLMDINLSGLSEIYGLEITFISDFCPNLEILNLASCSRLLDIHAQKIFQKCKKLKIINIELCHSLSDLTIIAIGENCENLIELSIESVHLITDLGVRSLASKCKKLMKFNAKLCTGLSSTGLIELIENCPNLEEINLSDIRKVGDNLLIKISENCKKLKMLELTNCRKITSPSISMIAENCTKLEKLYLENCFYINDDAIISISENCFNLKVLDVINCGILTDSSIISLRNNCPCLNAIYCSGCRKLSVELLVKLFPKEVQGIESFHDILSYDSGFLISA